MCTHKDAKEMLKALKVTGDIYRQGILFKTERNQYFYDTGTGKIVLLSPEISPIFEALFDKETSDKAFSRIVDEVASAELFEAIEKEHLLSNPKVMGFYNEKSRISIDKLQCEQLIIELTGKCNLRCRYCIYGDHYEDNRSYNSQDISFETAKKAIDYAYAHRSPEMFAVSFYGGEPLVNFKTMKQCIEYSLEKCVDCNLAFSFTTNLTLLTKEIAEYVVQIPNISIVVSLDGPEAIQNRNRPYANQRDTFSDAYRGLVLLADAIKKYNSNTVILINAVLMPPYTKERFDQINDFFESLNFLPEGTEVTATYPSFGSVPDYYYEDLAKRGYNPSMDISFIDWAVDHYENNGLGTKPNIQNRLLISILTRVHNRILLEKPIGKYSYNACCIPSYRRLYLSTDGTYKVCEKIGEAPTIGDVDNGIDIEAINKYYFKQYEEKSIEDCSKCWAINMCEVCYAECYHKNGISLDKKRNVCNYTRISMLNRLSVYHSLLETHPELIEYISTIEQH